MDWKKLYKKVLFPPTWLTVMLTIISTVALAAIFIKGWEMTPIAYVSYVVAFYTLSVIVLSFVYVFPKYYRGVKAKIYGNELGNRYMTDVEFKTTVSLYASLGVNLLYVAINLFWGILHVSAWFITLAAYYSILAVMRFLLVRYANKEGIRKNKVAELKFYRICGIILMPINLTLSGMVVLVIKNNRGFHYNGILIYVVAMYTFYITVKAIVDIIKYRKYDSPVMSAAKAVSLSAALVSMLSLETAMLSQFGTDTPAQTKLILIAATGAGVCAIVVGMATYMIMSSTKIMRSTNGIT